MLLIFDVIDVSDNSNVFGLVVFLNNLIPISNKDFKVQKLPGLFNCTTRKGEGRIKKDRN